MTLAAADNPFRTSRLEVLTYRAADAHTGLAQIVNGFRANAWHGCIVGPPDTGKSTLLRAPTDGAEGEGASLWRAFVNRQTPLRLRRLHPAAGSTAWSVDGWCHLPPWERARLRRLARRRGASILGTAHLCGWGLPTRWRTRACPRLLHDLVRELDPNLAPAEVDAAWRATRGRPREALWHLYEHRARGA